MATVMKMLYKEKSVHFLLWYILRLENATIFFCCVISLKFVDVFMFNLNTVAAVCFYRLTVGNIVSFCGINTSQLMMEYVVIRYIAS